MGYTTRFDELSDSAIKHIKEAHKELNEALFEGVWGYEEMKPEYIEKLVKIQSKLSKILLKLQ